VIVAAIGRITTVTAADMRQGSLSIARIKHV